MILKNIAIATCGRYKRKPPCKNMGFVSNLNSPIKWGYLASSGRYLCALRIQQFIIFYYLLRFGITFNQ